MFSKQIFIHFSMLVMVLFLVTLLFACGGAEDGDLIPPNVTFEGGIPSVTNDPGTDSGPHLFSGTSDPGTAFDVDIIPPAGGVGAIATVPVVQPNGDWSFIVYNLDEGLNQIGINASDPTGNTNILFVNIFLDLTGPTVTLDQFISYTPVSSQTLAGTIGEVNASIEYCVQYVVNPVCDPADVLDWSAVAPSNVNGTLWQHPFNFVAEDSYKVVVRGIDHLGNVTDSAEYASADIIYDSNNAPVFTVTQTLPIILLDPINTGVAALTGTYDSANFNLVLSTSPSTTWVFDEPIVDDWTLDFDNLPSGNTVVTFSIQNLIPVPVEVAQANILLVRDLSGPLLIDTVPAHGLTGVSTGTDLTLVFSETMDPATIDGTLITLEDDADPPNVVTVTVNLPSIDDREFTFTPDVLPLSASTKYNVTVNNTDILTATDQYGNAFIPPAAIWTFTTQ